MRSKARRRDVIPGHFTLLALLANTCAGTFIVHRCGAGNALSQANPRYSLVAVASLRLVCRSGANQIFVNSSVKSRRTDSSKNHPILIYWSEAEKCFIAEAPDCVSPARPQLEGGEIGSRAEVEALQGKGASPGEALSDALREIEVWARQQRAAPAANGSPVPPASRSAADTTWNRGRKSWLFGGLTVFIVGCAAFALSEWPRDLLSRVQPAPSGSSKAEIAPPSRIVQPPAIAPPSTIVQALAIPPSTAAASPKLVINASEVTTIGAAHGEPRKLFISVQWSVLQPRAGQAPKIKLQCTLIPTGKTSLDSARPAQTGSYEIGRAVLSTDQHDLTIELPDGIPAGDYELRAAISLGDEAPELLVRQISIPEADAAAKRFRRSETPAISELAPPIKNPLPT